MDLFIVNCIFASRAVCFKSVKNIFGWNVVITTRNHNEIEFFQVHHCSSQYFTENRFR